MVLLRFDKYPSPKTFPPLSGVSLPSLSPIVGHTRKPNYFALIFWYFLLNFSRGGVANSVLSTYCTTEQLFVVLHLSKLFLLVTN